MNIRSIMLCSTIVTSFRFRAYEPGNAGWKLDKDGKIEMKDGNPIWIDANGGENTLDGNVITRLNGDVRTQRQRAEKAEADLVPFKGIDPVAAKTAIEKTKDLDLGKLIDVGKLDEVRREITQQFTGQIAEKDKALADRNSAFDNLMIDNVFANSEYIRDNVAMPRDFFQAALKSNFKVKEGKIEAYDRSGNPVYSKKNIGSIADPDEALEILVNSHPQKDTILKSSDQRGTGHQGGGGGRGGVRTIKRADFEKLPAQEQAANATAMGKGELTIVE